MGDKNLKPWTNFIFPNALFLHASHKLSLVLYNSKVYSCFKCFNKFIINSQSVLIMEYEQINTNTFLKISNLKRNRDPNEKVLKQER